MADPTPNTPLALPVPGDGPAIWDLVMADMAERDAMGTRKYGQRLVAFDGRDPLVDAYQEALDLAVYLRKAIAQRGTEAVSQSAPLSPGEQIVWAATFSLVLNGGSKAKLAARLATNAVDCLRMQAADPGDLYDAEVAHLQQMRGGR